MPNEEQTEAPANVRYADYPDHPLHDVPEAVLTAARDLMAGAVDCGDIHADMAVPLADATVMAVVPWLMIPARGGANGVSMPRQDSVTDQLRDVLAAANRMGCYDAADWIAARLTK